MRDLLRSILKRACRLPLLVLLMSVPAMHGQETPSLAQRLHIGNIGSALDAPNVEPWHMKLAVQLYDPKGKPGEQGTVEEWWAGPGKDKRVYAMPSYTATVVREDGKMFRTPGASYPPLLVDLLLDQVIHAMPDDTEVENAQLQMKQINFGKIPLDCIMLAQPIKDLKTVPMGLFPTYCFDPGKSVLRLDFNYGTQLVIRNSMATFQSRVITTDLAVRTADVTAATGHVADLAKQTMTDADFATDGLIQIGVDAPVKVASGVIAGMALKQVQPVYPQSAKDNHVTGVVTMHALIGTDGHIYRLRLISSADPDLAIAALAAVRQWTYRPYLLNGVPVEVETTINVNFTMN
jgi:TonB family protein